MTALTPPAPDPALVEILQPGRTVLVGNTGNVAIVQVPYAPCERCTVPVCVVDLEGLSEVKYTTEDGNIGFVPHTQELCDARRAIYKPDATD